MGNDYMDVSSYSMDTITLTNDCETVTITDDSGFTLQGMTSSSGTYTIDTSVLDNSISIGSTKLTEDELKDIMVLIDIIKDLDDDNPIKALFNSKKMLNKMKVKDE
jgi:hypothetical protein|tara:strand:+ start:6502 stop:6819 length:318 start_codon:yes stop_codon:yes gene_type:complete